MADARRGEVAVCRARVGEPQVDLEAIDGNDLGVLSLLAARGSTGSWRAVAGSLLAAPSMAVERSWRAWAEAQPDSDRWIDPNAGFDLGPRFDVEPFTGLRAVRRPVRPAEWNAALAALTDGRIDLPGLLVDLPVVDSSTRVRIFQDGLSETSGVVAAAHRPIDGISLKLGASDLPAGSDDTWKLAVPPGLSPGPVLGRLHPHRRLLHWPQKLLGIDWLGSPDFDPPAAFVVGKMVHEAWIARVRPDDDQESLLIDLCWDERAIDVFGLSILVRNEDNGLTLLSHQFRISDLPHHGPTLPPGDEMWRKRWWERTFTVRLPRGPRRTDWGVVLVSSDGRVLDERPVATRIETIYLSFSVNGLPGSTSTIGDGRPDPERDEQNRAIELAAEARRQAQRAAAGRRFSSRGELVAYLRWRLSGRAGELRIVDPYAGKADAREEDLAFLASFGRPIRLLTNQRGLTLGETETYPDLSVRRLNGEFQSHDRIWLFGEGGLMLGSSLNTFRAKTDGKAGRITTASELPNGDVALWNERFEDAWSKPG